MHHYTRKTAEINHALEVGHLHASGQADGALVVHSGAPSMGAWAPGRCWCALPVHARPLSTHTVSLPKAILPRTIFYHVYTL